MTARAFLTVAELDRPTLRLWRGPDLLAELELDPHRALHLAEQLIAAGRRTLARETAPLTWPPARRTDPPDPGP